MLEGELFCANHLTFLLFGHISQEAIHYVVNALSSVHYANFKTTRLKY